MYGDSQYRRSGDSSTRRSVRSRWDKVARSGLVTIVGLLLLLACCGALWIAHIRGRIHRFTTTQEVPEQTVAAARLGGQEIVHLNRFEVGGSLVPEFSGAALAPGYGMLLLQAILSVPGHGEFPIVFGTPELKLKADTAQAVGGEFSVRVDNTESGRGAEPVELVAGRTASQQDSTAMPGGSRLDAHFSPDIHLPAGGTFHTGVDTVTSASISNRGLELNISAKNNGATSRSLMLAWQSRFAAPGAGLHGLSVQPVIPSTTHTTSHTEMLLGGRDLDETYSDFEHGYLSNGPEVLLRNRADGYTLRFRALAPSIRSMHVQASRQDNSVLIGFSTAAGGSAKGEKNVLAPGESLQWRVRIEAVQNTDAPTAQ